MKPITRSATIATKYRIHTSSSGGMTDTTILTTTYIPPQILEAKVKYKEPNKVFFIFYTLRFLIRSKIPLTERCSHLHSTKSRSVLLVHRFQIMESNTLSSPLVHFLF